MKYTREGLTEAFLVFSCKFSFDVRLRDKFELKSSNDADRK